MRIFRTVWAAWLAASTTLAATSSLAGEPFKLMHAFAGAPAGSRPYAALVAAPDGSLYGTTGEGGTSTHCLDRGCGTIFRTKPNGATTILHSFDNVTDGSAPLAGLLLASDGNFYGTTYIGGPLVGGTLFSISPKGKFKLLHTFQRAGAGGSGPAGTLAEGPDGAIYGTTNEGGAGTGPQCFVDHDGCGTVFKYTRRSGVEVLHSFSGDGGDGAFPSGSLLMANDGNLYGTTYGGGAQQRGTLYRITPGGVMTVLHQFDVATGAEPNGGLVQAADGALYGTTFIGGSKLGGTVFRITTAGEYSLVHEFDYDQGDDGPIGTLVIGPRKLLYGVLLYGGDLARCWGGCGSAYSVSMTGEFARLHVFAGGDADGRWPSDGLVRFGDKKLAGMTQYGGAQGVGVIYTINP